MATVTHAPVATRFRKLGRLGAVPGGAQISEHQRIMAFENQVVSRTRGGVRRLVNLAELLNDPAFAPIDGRGWQADDVTGRALLVTAAAWTTAAPPFRRLSVPGCSCRTAPGRPSSPLA
jgi:hypothetical protein